MFSTFCELCSSVVFLLYSEIISITRCGAYYHSILYVGGIKTCCAILKGTLSLEKQSSLLQPDKRVSS